MKTNNPLIIIFSGFLLIIFSVYFINQWLVREMQEEFADERSSMAAGMLSDDSKAGQPKMVGEAFGPETEDKANKEQGKKEVEEKAEPIYEAPLESVILMH